MYYIFFSDPVIFVSSLTESMTFFSLEHFPPNHGVQSQSILKYYKTMKNNQPIAIMLTPSTDLSICPVQA